MLPTKTELRRQGSLIRGKIHLNFTFKPQIKNDAFFAQGELPHCQDHAIKILHFGLASARREAWKHGDGK